MARKKENVFGDLELLDNYSYTQPKKPNEPLGEHDIRRLDNYSLYWITRGSQESTREAVKKWLLDYSNPDYFYDKYGTTEYRSAEWELHISLSRYSYSVSVLITGDARTAFLAAFGKEKPMATRLILPANEKKNPKWWTNFLKENRKEIDAIADNGHPYKTFLDKGINQALAPWQATYVDEEVRKITNGGAGRIYSEHYVQFELESDLTAFMLRFG